LRKLVIACSLALFASNSLLQLSIIISFQAFYLTYLLLIRPFKGQVAQWQSVFNEIGLIFIMAFCLAFDDFGASKASVKQDVGYLILAIAAVLLVGNSVILGWNRYKGISQGLLGLPGLKNIDRVEPLPHKKFSGTMKTIDLKESQMTTVSSLVLH